MKPPFPGCACPPSYVRDACNGHPEAACRFHGIYGLELAAAHRAAAADGQLALF